MCAAPTVLLAHLLSPHTGLDRVLAEVTALRGDVTAVRGKVDRIALASAYVFPPTEKEKAKATLFYVLDGSAKAQACGFFISPRLALTVSHARKECEVDSFMSARTLTDDALTFTIRYDDGDDGENKVDGATNLDFMVLELCSSYADRADHFSLTHLASPESLVGSKHVALLACGIAMTDEVQPHFLRSLTIDTASVTHAGTRHFVYSSTIWDGDSGGCLFFNDDLQVVGLHLEGVNRARELVEHTKDLAGVPEDSAFCDGVNELLSPESSSRKRSRVEGAIKTVSASIRDVIRTVTTGGLGLFLGCDEVRCAIASVNGGGGGGGGGSGAGGPAWGKS